jgi:hypothetical protein
MNYIKHLAGFFDRVAKDDRLGPLHVSMYVSLFQFWNASHFKNPISISRNELMRVSKISAKATYHKCIRELNAFGYLKYEPSFNPIRGSLIYLFNFETGGEPVNESKRTKTETASRQVEEPYINYKNNTKHKTRETARPGIIDEQIEKPTLDEAFEFFAGRGSTKLEAEKFFNHFESNGWKVGGRSPMKNWRAAAQKWILNTGSFSKTLAPNSEKNYAEPL